VDPRRALTTRCLKITQQESQNDRISRRLSIVQNHEEITDANKEAVEEFVDSLKAAKKPRLSKTLQYITNMKKLLTEYCEAEDLRELDMEELRRTMGRMEADSSISENYKYDLRVTINKFFRTMHPFEWERPDRVRRILHSDLTKLEAPPESERDRTPFTAEEVLAMHKVASNKRDALIPLFAFETGARKIEVLGSQGGETTHKDFKGIRLKDIEMNREYAEVEIETAKKDEEQVNTTRKNQLFKCVGALRKWLNEHPEADNPDSHLFVNVGNKNKGERLRYERYREIIQHLAKKAGVEEDRDVDTHIFRHSSITHKGIEEGRNEADIMDWHGIEDSTTVQKYLHNDERRLREKRLKKAGIEIEEDENIFEAKVCPDCTIRYSPDEHYCAECGLALSRDAVEKKKKLKEAGNEVTEAQLNQGLSDEELEKVVAQVRESL
jgi:integrase